MIRRAVMLAVIAGWLVSQLAAMPHAHATGDTAHSARPHVHLGGHGHCHHHAAEVGHSHAPRSPMGHEIVAPSDHDQDAFYFAADVTLGLARLDSPELDSAIYLLPVIGCDVPVVSISVTGIDRVEVHLHGPPRFLMLRTLRI